MNCIFNVGVLYNFLKTFVASNLSSRQCDQRRSVICDKIKTCVVGKEDAASFVKQSDLLSLLNLTVKDKSLLTRCVQACLPSSTLSKNDDE